MTRALTERYRGFSPPEGVQMLASPGALRRAPLSLSEIDEIIT
jgi:hypothetical protein